MLKPVDPLPSAPSERPIGELVHQLIEDGKAYALAEVALIKAIATEKARALAWPAGLFGAALLCVLAGITALAVGVVIALAKFIGPLLAGLAGLVIFAAIAGALAWLALGKLKSKP